MQSHLLHIVCLDVPFPPNYGGAIDMYYRIKAFHELGWKVILHTFEYGRGKHHELNEICEKVYYYKRKTGFDSHLNKRPYIVQSRINKNLINRLKEDDYPIWLEGIHCCGLLEDEELQKRAVFVRLHNIEQDYYSSLAKQSSGWKRTFFMLESKKLVKYEPILKRASRLFAIQDKDVIHYKNIHPKTTLLPPAFPWEEMEDYDLKNYYLFHGNLSVPENEQAAVWLAENVMAKLPNELFIIAGKAPSIKLTQFLTEFSHIQLVADPSEKVMNKLIGEAKNHLLYTEQATGVKLKLIHVLQSQGHVIVNSKMVEGTPFGAFCRIAHSSEDFISFIQNNAEPMTCSTRDRWKFMQDMRPEIVLVEKVIPYLFHYL